MVSQEYFAAYPVLPLHEALPTLLFYGVPTAVAILSGIFIAWQLGLLFFLDRFGEVPRCVSGRGEYGVQWRGAASSSPLRKATPPVASSSPQPAPPAAAAPDSQPEPSSVDTRAPSPNPPPPMSVHPLGVEGERNSAELGSTSHSQRFPTSPFFSHPSDHDEDQDESAFRCTRETVWSRDEARESYRSSCRSQFKTPRMSNSLAGSPPYTSRPTTGRESASQPRHILVKDPESSRFTPLSMEGNQTAEAGAVDVSMTSGGNEAPTASGERGSSPQPEASTYSEEEYFSGGEEEEEEDLREVVMNLLMIVEDERRRVDQLQHSMRSTMQMLSTTLASLRMLDAPTPRTMM